MKDFPTRETLMTMPIKVLRGLDIESPEQQDLVQSVVSERMADLPPERPVFRNDVPDIQNPEQEMHWQEIIDQRTRRLKGLEPISQDEVAPGADELPAAVSTTEETGPDGQVLAQPTGEGEPVTFNGQVNSALQSADVVAPKRRGRPAKNS
jgi:hypothetical protein